MQNWVGGDVFTFATIPAFEFSRKPTGRFGALKIVGWFEKCLGVVALDCISAMPLSVIDVTAAQRLREKFGDCDLTTIAREAGSIIEEKRLSETGDISFQELFGSPILARLIPDTDYEPMGEFRLIGNIPVGEYEKELVQNCRIYSNWDNIGITVEQMYRLRYDREAYLLERERSDREAEERRTAERLRYETRLKGLTWDKLLSEDLFARWVEHPPFPTPAFSDDVRAKFCASMLALQALGKKPTRAAVRAVMKPLIEWLNAEDDEAGNPIETEERGDLHELIQEMLHVARQPALVDEIVDLASW
jgi:hypothetical protein